MDTLWELLSATEISQVLPKMMTGDCVVDESYLNVNIAEKLGGYFSTFGGNPVACAIGKKSFI